MMRMKFIDIHAHVYPDAIAWKAAQSIRNYYHIGEEMDGTPRMLMERGELAGVSKYLILPVAVKPEHVKSINNFILTQAQAHDCFVAFGTVHAGLDNSVDEVNRIQAMGL